MARPSSSINSWDEEMVPGGTTSASKSEQETITSGPSKTTEHKTVLGSARYGIIVRLFGWPCVVIAAGR
jgi:hypothetical protein